MVSYVVLPTHVTTHVRVLVLSHLSCYVVMVVPMDVLLLGAQPTDRCVSMSSMDGRWGSEEQGG